MRTHCWIHGYTQALMLVLAIASHLLGKSPHNYTFLPYLPGVEWLVLASPVVCEDRGRCRHSGDERITTLCIWILERIWGEC